MQFRSNQRVDDRERRRVLQAVGATAAAGGIAGLAGCTDSLDSVVGGSNAGSFGDLAYAPGEIDDVGHYGVRYLNVDTVVEAEDDLPESLFDSFERRHEPLHEATDVDFDDATAAFSFRTTTVLQADHDTEDVADELDDHDFDDEDPIGDFEVYLHDDDTSVVAFDGSRIVQTKPTSSENDPEDVFETVQETIAGEEDRYVDESEAFDSLLAALEGADAFRGSSHEATDDTDAESGQFEDETARGVRATFQPDDDAAAVDFVLVFEGADAVDADAVSTWSETDAFENYDDVSVSTDGAVVTVETALDLENYSLGVPRNVGEAYSYVPAPSAVELDEHVEVLLGRPGRAAENEAANDVGIADITTQAAGVLPRHTGVDATSFETVTSFGSAAVGLGGFEADTVSSHLEAQGFDSSGTYEGFDLYTGRGVAVALSGEVVVAAEDTYSSGLEPTTVAERIIDANYGDTPRFTEEDDDFGLLTDHLGVADFVSASTQEPTEYGSPSSGEFEGTVASGISVNFEGSDTVYRNVNVYDAAESVDMSAVDEFVEERESYSTGIFGDASEISTSQDGRVVTIDVTTPTDEL